MTWQRWLLGLVFAASSAACETGSAWCSAGATRACTIAMEGGFAQSGTQSCGADHAWSECVGYGTCSGPSGAPLAAYARCASDGDCGPAGCASCGSYGSVQNPGGARVCYPFCQSDDDCAPGTASAGVTPRCALGQCILLCRAGSTCPRDAQCLPWLDGDAGSAYPGYDGLCN